MQAVLWKGVGVWGGKWGLTRDVCWWLSEWRCPGHGRYVNLHCIEHLHLLYPERMHLLSTLNGYGEGGVAVW